MATMSPVSTKESPRTASSLQAIVTYRTEHTVSLCSFSAEEVQREKLRGEAAAAAAAAVPNCAKFYKESHRRCGNLTQSFS